MTGETVRPIIIKKKKGGGGDGHHGGAWKVAYADFVTAMMAFFMLMWLLNATTEQQRKGLADYFAPSIPISRTSGGGDGAFGGNDLSTSDAFSQSLPRPESASDVDADAAAQIAAMEEIEALLTGSGGEALLSERALRHVVTRLTDEGLVIEIFALPDAPIFAGDSDQPTQMTRDIIEMVARVSSIISNPVAVGAHIASRPIVRAGSPAWDISGSRADVVRRTLEGGGLNPARIKRVTGHADRSPFTDNPLDARNERVEITLLRPRP